MVEDANLSDSPAAAQEKRELRAVLREQRLALPAAERMRAAESVARLVQADSPLKIRSGYVAGYWAMGGELPLHVVQLRLRDDQVWCLPCVQSDNSLRFAPWRPGDELVSNRYGIPEPVLSADAQLRAEDMTLVLVPLLGFTREGSRLGMGGGFYDRSFAFRRQQSPPPLLVGVGYAFQELATLPHQAWDVRVDALLTDARFTLCAADHGQ